MISPLSEVVITGVGVTSPIGIGYEAMRDALAERHQRRPPAEPVRFGRVPGSHSRRDRRFRRQAIRHAPQKPEGHVARYSTGVRRRPDGDQPIWRDGRRHRLGSFRRGLRRRHDSGRTRGADQRLSLLHRRRPNSTSRVGTSERWPSSTRCGCSSICPTCRPATWRSRIDARGPNNTIVLAEASSLAAMGEAVRVLERGAADVMIVGGTGSRIHPLSWCFRDTALQSPRHDDPSGVSRPFDARRDGMVYGEGSAAFILETRRHAEARHARSWRASLALPAASRLARRASRSRARRFARSSSRA